MNLRQEITDSIRATILKDVLAELRIELKEAVAELRAESLDELREQARSEIQDEIEEREENEIRDGVYEEARDDYYDRNHEQIAKDVERGATAVIRKIRQECHDSINEALAELRQQIQCEFDNAVSQLKADFKGQAAQLTEEFRNDLRNLTRDNLREAIQSVTKEILNTAGPESPELSTPSVATSRPTEPSQTSQPIDLEPSQSQNSRETFRRAFGDINRFDLAPEKPPGVTEAPRHAANSGGPSQ